jgi:hypothetical protein
MKDKTSWGFGCKSSGGIALKKTRAARVAEKKEDNDPVTVGSHSNFPKGRQPSDL